YFPRSAAYRALPFFPTRRSSDLPSVNVVVSTQLPPGRWILLAGGPAWGPAVLFWGYLAIVLLVALTLGRLPLSPLQPWEWALQRSEEHTSELQSRGHLVCRLLLE